ARVSEPAQSFRTPLFGFAASTPEPVVTPRTATIPVAVTPTTAPAALSAPPVGTTVALPLPPERPFDLGTIPNAATPVMSAVPRTVSTSAVAPRQKSPAVAALFYAEPARVTMRFEKTDPWAALKTQTFRPLSETH
ncbi:MAG: hypothetical protein ABWZ80_09350, partial [Beijerinckiaceae bacterium]